MYVKLFKKHKYMCVLCLNDFRVAHTEFVIDRTILTLYNYTYIKATFKNMFYMNIQTF